MKILIPLLGAVSIATAATIAGAALGSQTRSASGSPPPMPPPSSFSARVDNPWFPLLPGTRWVYNGVNVTFATPLQSPVWRQLGSVYRNLVVLPAWQCDSVLSPGGVYGYRYFGFLAGEQNMSINSYYTARYTGKALETHCKVLAAELPKQPLAPYTAYVVSPAIAAQIESGPTGPGKCHGLDGFILCSPQTDFGLPPRTMDQPTSSTTSRIP